MSQLFRHLLPTLLLAPIVASATVVTTVTDEDNGSLGGGTGISLREAVKYSPAADTITFAPALSGQTIRLTLGEMLISKSLTINGSSLPVKITLSGDRTGNGKTSDDTRIINISNGSVILDSLILDRGYLASGTGKHGAAIHVNNSLTRLTVKNSVISNNETTTYGGGIFFVGNPADPNSSSLTLQSCTLTGNKTGHDGGAIYNSGTLRVEKSAFSNNIAYQGCGIFQEAGVATVEDSTFTTNAAYGYGGAICNEAIFYLRRSTITENSAVKGGGIYSAGNIILIEDSTISGNSALNNGGGIHTQSGYTDLQNSTIATNTANELGGGIFVRNTTDARNCTIAANSAGISGGGLAEGVAYLRATIVAGNTAPSSPDIFLREVDTTGNLITPILSLAPLGNYGGPTQTMPPLTGSPAIDPIPASSTLTTDQRGFKRDGRRDIGAVEYQRNHGTYDDASIINDIVPQIWTTDADRDGLPYAIEHLHGTNPFLPDSSSPATLSAPVLNAAGYRVLTFILNQNASIPNTSTSWRLMRSPDLTPDHFAEIYRYGSSGETAIPGVSIFHTPASGETERVTITDSNPLPGGAFYRFEAVLETD